MKNQISKFTAFISFLFLFQINLQAKTVIGIVTDVKSGQPLKDVIIMIVDTTNTMRAMEMSDSSGAFIITGITQNKFQLRTYRYGYVSTTTGPYNLTTHDTLSMLIRLEATPFTLAEIEVTAKKIDPYLDKVNFYERKNSGNGKFITWEDIKNRGINNVYTIFKSIPGLISTRKSVSFSRYSAISLAETQTEPVTYIDGLFIPEGFGLSEIIGTIGFLNPDDILGIEIYNAINAPVQYSKGLNKGVMLIWTKH